MKPYRVAGAVLAPAFAAVLALFLFAPSAVLAFFNRLSEPLGMAAAPTQGFNFFLILAVGYMYVVTVLAVKMYLNPNDPTYGQLLVHAKAASSILSLYLFATHAHYLIYLANFVLDGSIAIGVTLVTRPL